MDLIHRKQQHRSAAAFIGDWSVYSEKDLLELQISYYVTY